VDFLPPWRRSHDVLAGGDVEIHLSIDGNGTEAADHLLHRQGRGLEGGKVSTRLGQAHRSAGVAAGAVFLLLPATMELRTLLGSGVLVLALHCSTEGLTAPVRVTQPDMTMAWEFVTHDRFGRPAMISSY
jgi:hypothetical protein